MGRQEERMWQEVQAPLTEVLVPNIRSHKNSERRKSSKSRVNCSTCAIFELRTSSSFLMFYSQTIHVKNKVTLGVTGEAGDEVMNQSHCLSSCVSMQTRVTGISMRNHPFPQNLLLPLPPPTT